MLEWHCEYNIEHIVRRLLGDEFSIENNTDKIMLTEC